MIYIAISIILFNVLVVFFKLFEKYNIDKMYRLIRNGPKIYPGAKTWVKKNPENGDGRTRSLEYIQDVSSIVFQHLRFLCSHFHYQFLLIIMNQALALKDQKHLALSLSLNQFL